MAGIDPSIFFDDDGRAHVLDNGPPPGTRWEGHRAIWLQEIDLKRLAPAGPRTVLVDGGADPSTKPYWIEGLALAVSHAGGFTGTIIGPVGLGKTPG